MLPETTKQTPELRCIERQPVASWKEGRSERELFALRAALALVISRPPWLSRCQGACACVHVRVRAYVCARIRDSRAPSDVAPGGCF
jgi:hypothetical protein